jgi:hypothetical protein
VANVVGEPTLFDEGLSDNKEHFSQSISVGQIEIGQIKIGSFEEYERFQRQAAQQIPSNSKGDAHQQEGQSLSTKQHATTIPRASNSSPGAGQHERQVIALPHAVAHPGLVITKPIRFFNRHDFFTRLGCRF